ncbi:type 2 isopentenyl-diphosphate Delta-isomerase [Lactobacillus xujianguonis]|uniref:Isopentenyl-diphosphate delta-isomerase n=1 Tax=Lactobacillus xujianguonis TaxID=2495899 RepID=A0A437SXR3_9LACO|nr:type 2 isopentenyl-diphosphate Delta-isomerase [Lactobacillus xujianguonis]RVU71723.1 type 2 isopentenyl-diphosphate Delta-isomerase [Lactobacillus xujianguonis]RVU77553.1 type 2 isopentenyl-diphosphate Delta-isomerase [Lactobacillus xujianguonis]
MSKRSERKEEHLALAQMFFNKKKSNSFDQMQLLRPALPETKVDLNSIQTSLFGKQVAAPFFINAMTGGSTKSLGINRALGEVARKTKIALALGSASILVKEKDQLESFDVAREANPDGIVIANVNPATPASSSKEIVEQLQADALQIHLNTVQEIAMPEGDRNFTWLENLQEIRQTVTVPVIIKEVGFGLDQATIHHLKNEGFTWFDVAGKGGTNFAEIENSRNQLDLSYLEELGLSTVISALMAQKEAVNFIVSGGVRNPLDVLKGLVLGGKAVGVANTFLQALTEHDQDYLLQMIKNWQQQLAALFAVYGVSEIKQVTKIKSYFDLPLKTEIEQLI